MSNALLDLDASARGASWRFELYDGDEYQGNLTMVDRGSAPTLSVDVSRAIKRTLTNVILMPNEINEVNVVRWSMKLVMELSDGTLWPQGVFRWADVSRPIVSDMDDIVQMGAICSFTDQLMIVDQQMDRSVSYAPGTNITDAIAELLAELPIAFSVLSSSAMISPQAEAIAWTIGTSRLKIINDLAAMIGYHDLYFDNAGVGQLSLMPDPLIVNADVLQYPKGKRTFFGTGTRSTNLLDLPNRFVVVNNGATQVPVYGEYDIPLDAPHSFESRGFFVTHVEQFQGLASNADAQNAAEALGRLWRFPYETVEFAGPPDPRHDHYNIVNFEGDQFLELSHSMSLKDGTDHKHVLRRTYGASTGGV
jgi:hypothetical protein